MAVHAAGGRARILPIAFIASLLVCLSSQAGYQLERAAPLPAPATLGSQPAFGGLNAAAMSAEELPARAEENTLSRKWRAVEASIAADRATMARCRAAPESCASHAALRLNAIVDTARMREGRGRIGEINRAINLTIKATADNAQFGMADVWSSPLATFTAGTGDCEDYAIAKYAALQEAGVPAADLRLLLVRNEIMRQDHAVTAVRHDGRWLILDNRRMAMIEERHFDLKPLFVLDRDGVASAGRATAPSGAQVSRSGGGAPFPM